MYDATTPRKLRGSSYKNIQSWPRELLVGSFLLIAGRYLTVFVVGFQPTCHFRDHANLSGTRHTTRMYARTPQSCIDGKKNWL